MTSFGCVLELLVMKHNQIHAEKHGMKFCYDQVIKSECEM